MTVLQSGSEMNHVNTRVKTVVNGLFYENCFIVWEPGGTCIILDPGDEALLIESMVREMELTPVLIASTHGHVDFIGAVAELRDSLRVPFAIHSLEEENIERLTEEARLIGLPTVSTPTVDRWLDDGESLTFGDCSLQVMHTPGHTAGSICFVGDQLAFVGDTLFAGGYGRTDLPGGDEDTLISSIKEKILTLDETTIIYPGHGPSTTIAEERRTNWIMTRLGAKTA